MQSALKTKEKTMACLICRYFQPNEPAQHKKEREAGQCQSSCGNKWDQHTAINYVRNHGQLDGFCRLHPEPKLYGYNHVCGDVSVRKYFLNHHWRVEPFGPQDNLFEWACEALTVVLHGDDSFLTQARRTEEQNVELRRKLKRAREISASRLKRLQKIEPVSEPERPAEPFRPHLVAAE
jgi:hypothetical protein